MYVSKVGEWGVLVSISAGMRDFQKIFPHMVVRC